MQLMDSIFIIRVDKARLVAMSKMLIYLQNPANSDTEKPLVYLRVFVSY
jgi:hypothetical protein